MKAAAATRHWEIIVFAVIALAVAIGFIVLPIKWHRTGLYLESVITGTVAAFFAVTAGRSASIRIRLVLLAVLSFLMLGQVAGGARAAFPAVRWAMYSSSRDTNAAESIRLVESCDGNNTRLTFGLQYANFTDERFASRLSSLLASAVGGDEYLSKISRRALTEMASEQLTGCKDARLAVEQCFARCGVTPSVTCATVADWSAK